MRVAYVAFGLLVLGLLAWFLLSEGTERGDAPEVADPGPAPAPPRLVGTKRPAPEPVPAAAPAKPAETESGSAAAPRYRVRGHVTGVPAAEAGALRVRVRPYERWGFVPADGVEVSGPVGAAQRFELDVTALFEGARSPGQLEVVVDHPQYVSGKQRIDVSACGESEVWEVTLTLERAAVATGLVTDERDQPLPGVAVAAYAMKGPAPAIGNIMPVPALDETSTDQEGRYRLRLAGSGAYVVAALGAPRLPDSAVVALLRGEATAVEALVLRAGSTLVGTARYAGEPIGGIHVAASPAEGGRGGGLFSLGSHMVTWRGGRMWSYELTATADENGAFRFEGLSSGPWHVALRSGAFAGLDCVSFAALRDSRVSITIPATSVDVELRGALLRVRALDLDASVDSVDVFASDGSSSTSCSVPSAREARLLLAPGAEVQLEIRAEGYVPVKQKVRTPALGAARLIQVAMTPEPPRPTLIVRLRDEAGKPVPRAHFGIESKAVAQPEKFTQLSEENESGEYRLDRLHAGATILRVEPWRAFFDETGYGLTIERELTLPAEGEQVLELTARRGGRLRIAARDAEGKLLDAACTIRDADGAKQQVNFMTQRGSVSMSMPDRLGTLSPGLSDPPLEAGAYSVELEHEGVRKTVTARIEAGKTGVLDVKLGE